MANRLWLLLHCLTCCVFTCSNGLADMHGSNGQVLKLTLTGQLNVLLQPAREALLRGRLAECRSLAATVVSDNGDLPHCDVIVATWLMEARDFQAAQHVLEEVAKQESARPDIHFQFSALAMNQNRMFDAWVHIQASESADYPKRWSQAYCEQFASQIQRTKAMIADRRSDWLESQRILSLLKKGEPTDPMIEIGLGRAAFHLGNTALAESHFALAANYEPDEYVPELLMARLYEEKGDAKQVHSWLRKGERNNYPNSNRVRLEHCRWLISQNQAGAAREIASQAKPNKEQNSQFDFLLALTDQMEGKHGLAEQTLARLHQENPSNPLVSNRLALSLVESVDEGKRGRALQIATANAKNSLDDLVALAWIQHRLGDSKSAASTAAIALKQNGQLSRDSAYFLGTICESLGRKTEASQLFEAARSSKGEFIFANRLAP